ncbi:MAG: hypothetical protein M1823_001347 [Watsoniomyces obsoletus]|nr:MAG: hypothetical protein M1823_001347 [Watsoniomyces obsoletus]
MAGRFFGRGASGRGGLAPGEEDFEIPFLKEIYRPEGEPPLVDLVFVHGLNPFGNRTHAWDTWRHTDGAFWPTDFLPDDLPRARVLLYGYNSNVAFDVSEARIKHHAEELLTRLEDERESISCRIIFIAHSLGGLVVKQALLNARDNPVFTTMLQDTYGFMFFGVPHRGAGGLGHSAGELGARVARFVSGGRADNELLDCLKRNSLFTRDAADRFSHQLEGYHVVSYFETVPTKIAAAGGVSFHSEIVVDEDSAVLSLPGHRERRLGLNADHSSMCKIARKGDVYKGILANLRRLVKGASGQNADVPLGPESHSRWGSDGVSRVHSPRPDMSPPPSNEHTGRLGAPPQGDSHFLHGLGVGGSSVKGDTDSIRRSASTGDLGSRGHEPASPQDRPGIRNLPGGVTSSSNVQEAESGPNLDDLLLEALVRTTLEEKIEQQQRQEAAAAASISLMASLFDLSSALQTEADPEPQPEAVIKVEAEAPTEETLASPPPEPMVISNCSVCHSSIPDFPCYTCTQCYGKTVICQRCAPNMHLYPASAHKVSHRVREWQNGVWYHMGHTYLHTLEAPVEAPWGPQFEFSNEMQLQLGGQTTTAQKLIFGPRAAAELRLALCKPIPGKWDVCFQISTWPSSFFADAEIRLLRTTKRVTVRMGATALGTIAFAIGTPSSAEAYLDRGEGQPAQEWMSNAAGTAVQYGQKTMIKVKMPHPFVIEPGQDLGIWVGYARNGDGFAKENEVVKQRLSWCWALEGIRLEQHGPPGTFG